MSAPLDQAKSLIEADDGAGLRALLDAHPGLLQWRDPDDGKVLLQATTSYANFPGIEDEEMWNQLACARVLLEAGAAHDPRVALRALTTGALQLLALLDAHDAVPRNLRTAAALGSMKRVEAMLGDGQLAEEAAPSPELVAAYPGAAEDWPPADDTSVVADAVLIACRLGHEPVARRLMAHLEQMEPSLAKRDWVGFFLEHTPDAARFQLQAEPGAALIPRTAAAIELHHTLPAGDLHGLRALLAREPWLLGPDAIETQRQFIEVASYSPDALPFIEALLAAEPAILSAPPPSAAVSYALEYGHADYLPALTRIWPVPVSLPHAAGRGALDEVLAYFDDDGPTLGELSTHNPFPAHTETWTVQDVLDRALAWAVQNGQYEVAEALLARGADINTRWSTHEPASILHEVAAAGRLEQIRWLVAHGIDTTLVDDRYQATAADWAEFMGQEAALALLEALMGD